MIRILNGAGAGREHIMRPRRAGEQTGPANETSRALFGEPLTPFQEFVSHMEVAYVQERWLVHPRCCDPVGDPGRGGGAFLARTAW